MLKIPVSHDIRKGAAADIFGLKSDTGDTDRVRRSLGHTMAAMNKGHTDTYIGRDKGDSMADTVQSSTSKTSTTREPLCNKSLEGDTVRAPAGSIDENTDQDLLQKDTDAALRGFVLENLDPRLRGFADNVLTVQTDTTSNTTKDNSVELMTDGCIALWDSSEASNEPAVLTATAEQFIRYFSTINLASVATETLPTGLASGNSRDPPTRFLHHCKTERCPRAFNSSLRRDQHQVNCRAEPPSLPLDNVEGDDTLTPSITTTTESQRKRKRKDINKASEGFLKRCPDSDKCHVEKEFATDHLLKNHRALHHDANWPKDTLCNFPSCQTAQGSLLCLARSFSAPSLQLSLPGCAAQAREYIGKIIPVAFQAARGVAKN
ncbi:hypothetical protein P153DRAFT_382125 [Dothidotthia symphoricarpi CBS 119687]|uniref:Uncharacterized protein n=1 Tax=Dothidotthia symphoricarpi CBS 119687 TaxID=1392245 RepID=A0A6A6AKL8_9PLEO|nr:uncharacterized protein P153DRAFT_382125 [Dothidotthia symphoricarpi CBS 119687]KAF2132502.1 hypothetical protein P153DRAFT_382125 [Dothidotthia symphoricarpi CBS 119687]